MVLAAVKAWCNLRIWLWFLFPLFLVVTTVARTMGVFNLGTSVFQEVNVMDLAKTSLTFRSDRSERLAPFTLEFQTSCGEDFVNHRLQLVMAMTSAVIWGAQIVIPDANAFEERKKGAGSQLSSLYSFELQQDPLRKVFRDYWCKPQQKSSRAAELWCSNDYMPTIINRSTAQRLLKKTQTPAWGWRQCDPELAFMGASSHFFAAQTWSLWEASDGVSLLKPMHVEVVKCDCIFGSKDRVLELSDQDWNLFWKVDSTLRFNDEINDLVQQIKVKLPHYQDMAQTTAQRLGYRLPPLRRRSKEQSMEFTHHVLQLLLEDPCKDKSADNCMNNTYEVGNVMLAEGVDPNLPVYVMNSSKMITTQPFGATGPVTFSEGPITPAAPRAMESLTTIYTLVTKELILGPLNATYAMAIDYVMASEAEVFVGNSIPDVSGYLMLSRARYQPSMRNIHYNGGAIPVEDAGLRVNRTSQETTFRTPIKWIFTARKSESNATFLRIKIAVRSALVNSPSIVPICLTSTAYGSPLAKRLLSMGVRVIYHTPVWSDFATKAWKDSRCFGLSPSTIFDVLRMDIPALGLPDEFLLFTESSVIFTKDVSWYGLLGESKQSKKRMKENDFAHGEFSFSKNGETGVPRYFAMSSGPELQLLPVEASVMLINRRVMRDTYPKFAQYVMGKLKLQCNPNLNEFYRKFYRDKDKDPLASFLPSIFNWRPYWAPNPSVVINNFAGFHCQGGTAAANMLSLSVKLADCTTMGTCDMLCDMWRRFSEG